MKKEYVKKLMLVGAMTLGVMLTGCNQKEQQEQPVETSAGQETNVEQESEIEQGTDLNNVQTETGRTEVNESKSGSEDPAENMVDPEISKSDGKVLLEGMIMEIGDNTFTINEIITSKTEDGGETAVVNNEEASLYTVNFEKETPITIRTIYDQGANYDDKPGSAADLQKDHSVRLQGEWVNDCFQAKSILMNIVK